MTRSTVAADPFEQIARQFDAVAAEAEAAPTLRALSMRDPIRGAPLILRDRDGEEEQLIEPGAWKGGGYACRKTGLPPDCPIVPLGSMAQDFYFLNTLGQVHVLSAASFGKGPIEALFQGRTGYLEWAWPRWQMPRSKGDTKTVKGYEADECRMELINACGFKGTFALEDKVRGRGAWRGDDGGLILHAGDAVCIDGKWLGPGEHGRHIYPARPRIGRPALKAAEAGEKGDGAKLLRGLQSWNWRRGELDARLALGWMMTAMVGGALLQRPVCFVTGPEGAGKTLLQNILRALMQDGLISTANTTAANIYQKLGQDALPVFADEMEAKEDTRATDRIIELARVSFSGDTLGRGGKDGQATSYRLMSSFLFSCIVAPPIDAQDASRRVALDVRPRESGAEDVLKSLSWTVDGGAVDLQVVGAVGARLLRRWADRWSTWDALRMEAHGFLRTLGHTARSADAFAPLMAGAHLALHDGPFDGAALSWWGQHLDAGELEETSSREDTWRRCFWHMLEVPSELLRKNNITRSVGDVLQAWRTSGDPGQTLDDSEGGAIQRARDCARELEHVGLSLSFPKGCDHEWPFARLWVPNKHPALHSLFEGTAWAGRYGQPGPWAGALRQAPEDYWEDAVSAKGLNKAARGLMIDLGKVLGA